MGSKTKVVNIVCGSDEVGGRNEDHMDACILAGITLTMLRLCLDNGSSSWALWFT